MFSIYFIGSDTLAEEPNMIQLTKLPADMNKVMLKKILVNTIECGGKVVEMTVNSKDRFAIVKFDTPAGTILYKYIFVPSVKNYYNFINRNILFLV
jgi:hypothetical protein